MAIILDDIRSSKCPLPNSKSGNENFDNLSCLNGNNMSNHCTNQLVTNTEHGLAPLNNDDHVTRMNKLDSLMVIDND